ncbi:MAG: molybdopterin-dependent oxidoreductase [Chloroflexi bacterium]|nr:molybdopterin-dependent oxidoreductase [Chloroflexota bacterium]
MNEQTKKAVCRWCHARCRVVVYSRDGKLEKIEEDRSDPRVDEILPATRGCPRLLGAREAVYHPDRVRFPLKRAGERGENKWVVVGWDEAMGDIAKRLKSITERYGPESLMLTLGTGRTTEWPLMRFLNLLGSPNIVGQNQICFGPVIGMGAAMMGWPLRHRSGLMLTKDAEGRPLTKCVFMIGIDPSQSIPRLWKSIRDAKAAGSKIIVADPRKTQTAELADLWLQLRPGTDAALVLSMLNVVIEEGLYDKDFVARWCHGFDKLAQRARAYSPEKTAKITGVPSEKIRAAARLYATNRPGVSVNGMGMEHLEDQQEAIQARLILSAIVGNIDVRGGEYLPGPMDIIDEVEMQLNEALSDDQKQKQIGADRFKLLAWPGRTLIAASNKRVWGKESNVVAYAHYPSVLRAVLTGKPYPVRAGITIGSNPMVTQANTKLVYQALKSLDLYVVKDYWLTPSAQLADYVLPTAGWIERPELYCTYSNNTSIIAGEAALPAKKEGEYDYWTDYDFFRALGLRMGQEENWPWESMEEAYGYQLGPLGMNFEEFIVKKNGLYFPPDDYKKYERKEAFGTPTGKLELYSTVLEKLGYDPLPEFHEPKESIVSRPDLAERFPLTLITGGRFRPYFHSEQRQIPSVRKQRPEPQVQIHPETAKGFGIQDGDWVWIETPRGRIRQQCRYFDGLDKQVVHCEHGWWFPELPGEEPWLGGVWQSNVNVLMDDDPDRCNRRSGGWPLKTALCRIERCKSY